MKVCDLFAGAGGFSQGALEAGMEPVFAANHWPAAVEVHERNHPGAVHATQDLQQFDWRGLPAHDIITASPVCQGFTPARGKDRPHHDAARATAWAVVSACEASQPRAVVIENVPQMLKWVLFPSWLDAMKRLGYDLSINHLDSAYFGVPQSRKRIFMVGIRHKPAQQIRNTRLFEDQVPIRPYLDLENLGFPIADARRIKMGKAPLAEATKVRIEGGRSRFGKEPFWVPYHAGNKTGYSVDRALWAITTRDDFAIINSGHMRMLTVEEIKAAMGFPPGYLLTDNIKLNKHLLGNAVVPAVAKSVLLEVADAA